jgi:hypothetical protein
MGTRSGDIDPAIVIHLQVVRKGGAVVGAHHWLADGPRSETWAAACCHCDCLLPATHPPLQSQLKLSPKEVDTLLNKKSGGWVGTWGPKSFNWECVYSPPQPFCDLVIRLR